LPWGQLIFCLKTYHAIFWSKQFLLYSGDWFLSIWSHISFPSFSSAYLNLSFNIFDGIWSFDFECDGFSRQSFDENLHSTAESKDQMQSWLFLDVVVGQSSAVFQLFTGKDQTLLVWWDSLLVLQNRKLKILVKKKHQNFRSKKTSKFSVKKNIKIFGQKKHQKHQNLKNDDFVAKTRSFSKIKIVQTSKFWSNKKNSFFGRKSQNL